MNKVITIHLDGRAYQLEEAGYDVLHTYLETAAVRLQGNPDCDEILSDIERAIAEKFRTLLNNYKTVVMAKEVVAALEEMGPIEADAEAAANPGATGSIPPKGSAKATTGEGQETRGGTPKRLYRVQEGAMISGVCNGIAAYANLDPTLVRLAFVLLTFLGGSGVLIYLVMTFVVPEARSPEEKAAACGDPSTTQEFIRRAKEGYYEAMKGFPNRQARREWQRRFKREMRANADQWRYHWHARWSSPVTVHPGMGVALPLVSLLHGAVNILWICAMVSLLATGMVFGLALPAGIPVWGAAVMLWIAYGIFIGSLKATRRICYAGLNQPKWTWSFVFLLDAVVWVMVVGVLLWLAVHYFPELHDAVRSIPALAHQAADDIRAWWKG